MTVRAILAGLLGMAQACSLMNLDDVDTVSCDDNVVCAPLNEERQDECEQYVCHASGGGCVLGTDFDGDGVEARACGRTAERREELDCDDTRDDRTPNAAEDADQQDNDCDGVIDEGIEVRPQPLFEPEIAEIEHVSYAVSEDELLIACSSAGAGNALYRIDAALEVQGGAFDACLSESESESTCMISEIAIARAGDATFAAEAQRAGCTQGILRLATASFADPSVPALIASPEACAGASSGIDLDADRGCTGGSRESGVLGVARLAAAGQTASNQALLGYVADELARPACGGGALREIELLAVDLLDEDLIAWSAPVPAGSTLGGGAPAIASWDGRGYFVAHGNRDGRARVSFVPLPVPRASCEGEGGLEVAELAPIEASGADHLALALGSIRRVCDDADLELGIAWQEGCGGQGALYFARAGFTR